MGLRLVKPIAAPAGRSIACSDDIHSVDDARNIAEDREQDIDPELKPDTHLQEHADRRQQNRENDANDIHTVMTQVINVS